MNARDTSRICILTRSASRGMEPTQSIISLYLFQSRRLTFAVLLSTFRLLTSALALRFFQPYPRYTRQQLCILRHANADPALLVQFTFLGMLRVIDIATMMANGLHASLLKSHYQARATPCFVPSMLIHASAMRLACTAGRSHR